MAIDDRKYHGPAKRGDVAGVAINASVAIDRIMAVLEKIAQQSGIDVTAELSLVQKISDDLEKQYDRLTGYTADSDEG